jgi:hypothetical protein
MDIFEIKKRIKNNKCTCFIVNYDKNKMVLVESVLLKFGYKWNGYRENRKLSYLEEENPFTININRNNIGKLTYSSISRTFDEYDVIVSELNERELEQLFINEPIYKPKRIKREI